MNENGSVALRGVGYTDAVVRAGSARLREVTLVTRRVVLTIRRFWGVTLGVAGPFAVGHVDADAGYSYLKWFEECGGDVVRAVGEDLGPAPVVRDVVVRLIRYHSSDVYVVGAVRRPDGLATQGRPIYPLSDVIKAFAMSDARFSPTGSYLPRIKPNVSEEQEGYCYILWFERCPLSKRVALIEHLGAYPRVRDVARR